MTPFVDRGAEVERVLLQELPRLPAAHVLLFARSPPKRRGRDGAHCRVEVPAPEHAPRSRRCPGALHHVAQLLVEEVEPGLIFDAGGAIVGAWHEHSAVGAARPRTHATTSLGEHASKLIFRLGISLLANQFWQPSCPFSAGPL